MKLADYDFDNLLKVIPKGYDFEMYITPRFQHHFITNKYENFTSQIIKKYLKPGGAFVDVGAHYGFYSLLVKKMNLKDSDVISVEPVKENFDLLNKNVRLNNFTRVKTINCAVSNKTGTRVFNVAEASDSSSFYNHPLTKCIRKDTVRTTTLDSLLKGKHINMIKIDTEGHELSVLSGMKQVVKNNPEMLIIIEFNPKCIRAAGRQPEELIDSLSRMDYEIYMIDEIERSLYKLTVNENSWNSMMDTRSYVNLLCVPKGKFFYIDFYSHTAELGGSELSMLELIRVLQEHNILVHVHLPYKGPLIQILEDSAVGTSIVPYNWWVDNNNSRSKQTLRSFLEALSTVNSSLKHVTMMNPDLIYTNTSTHPWGLYSAIKLHKPHIWHIREFGLTDHNLHYSLGERITKHIVSLSNVVITNSKAVKESYKGFVAPEKLKYIYNEIKVREKQVLSKVTPVYFKKSNSLKLLCLGTIMPTKGQIDAVLAIIKLPKKNNVELVIAGKTEDLAYFRKISKLVTDNKLNEKIHILGYQDNPYDLISSSDIVLVCSSNEAFGRVTAEAMLLKKAVIGTRSGGTMELVSDGDTGYLYIPKNIESLTRRILRYVDVPKLVRTHGNNGYRKITALFSKNAYVSSILKIIKKAISEGCLTSDLNSLLQSIEFLLLDSSLKSNAKSGEYQQVENELRIKSEDLERIQSAKFYKLWQTYCNLRDKILK